MSKITLAPNISGSGTFTIAAPNSNVDRTLTLPDNSGTVVSEVAGNLAYKQQNILGTVSQSAGVPTGAIIESGSNANGVFVKYANGTMICTLGAGGTSSPKSTGLVINWTFPAAFVSRTNLGVSGFFYCLEQNVSFRQGVLLSYNSSPTTGTFQQFLGRDFSSGLFDDYIYGITAVGRWY